jgi:hypothetical protein
MVGALSNKSDAIRSMVSRSDKNCATLAVFSALHACQFVHRGVTDLTLDHFAVVQHRKSECQPLGVVSYNLASGQRHRSTPSLKGLSSHGIADAKGALIPAKAGKTLTIAHAGPLGIGAGNSRQEQGDPLDLFNGPPTPPTAPKGKSLPAAFSENGGVD